MPLSLLRDKGMIYLCGTTLILTDVSTLMRSIGRTRHSLLSLDFGVRLGGDLCMAHCCLAPNDSSLKVVEHAYLSSS